MRDVSYPIKSCYFSIVPILCKTKLCLFDVVFLPKCYALETFFDYWEQEIQKIQLYREITKNIAQK